MEEESVHTKFVVCPHCNKPFLAFTGMDTPVEDQPCPFCHMTESGKMWPSHHKDGDEHA